MRALTSGRIAGRLIPRARARSIPGVMNGLENAYAAEVLDPALLAGDVAWWGYESIKLRLAASTFYSPDFVLVRADGSIEVHEVKGGFWEDDARAKIKVAASLYPFFRFVAVTRLSRAKGGGWECEEFAPAAMPAHR